MKIKKETSQKIAAGIIFLGFYCAIVIIFGIVDYIERMP